MEFQWSFQLLAVVRAHITALGGNAMVSFYMSELTLVDNPHKNQVKQKTIFDSFKIFAIYRNFNRSFQGQTLISVGGDVVFVTYFSANEHPAH